MREQVRKAMQAMTAEEFLAGPKIPKVLDTMGMECLIIAFYQKALDMIRAAHPEVQTFGDLLKIQDSLPEDSLTVVNGSPDAERIMTVFALRTFNIGILKKMLHEIALSYKMPPFEAEDMPAMCLALAVGEQHSILVPLGEVDHKMDACVLCLTFSPDQNLNVFANVNITDCVRHELQHYFQAIQMGTKDQFNAQEFEKCGSDFECAAIASMFGGFIMRGFVYMLNAFSKSKGYNFNEVAQNPETLKTMAERYMQEVGTRIFDAAKQHFEVSPDSNSELNFKLMQTLSIDFFYHMVQRWSNGTVTFTQNGFGFPAHSETFKVLECETPAEAQEWLAKMENLSATKSEVDDFLDSEATNWQKSKTAPPNTNEPKSPDAKPATPDLSKLKPNKPTSPDAWKNFKPPTFGPQNQFGAN